MELKSPAFEQGQRIPKKYTCQGQNISPPLDITQYPENTQSFAIVVEDLDAPSGIFDHWVTWNIAPSEQLNEDEKKGAEGKNSFGTLGYSGPCPPLGRMHRYVFKVYALDSYVQLANGTDKKGLYHGIKDHLLDEAELMGTYQKE
ncbi:MAG: YbhB/YbcL family Raf kinase inhibitor-like protein [Parachlamydiaceae bacterium]